MDKTETVNVTIQEQDEVGMEAYLPALIYNKSNILISAKYQSTILENKLLALALSNLSVTDTGEITFRMSAGRIRKILHGNSGSFYNQLNKAADSMTGRKIGYNDPELKKFEYMVIIIHSEYDKGYMTIDFNPMMKEYLIEMKGNYTKLSLPVMMRFNSVYAFRLYEFLRSRAYTPKNIKFPSSRDDFFTISATMSELKLILGVVNAADEKVKNILNNKKNPDYDAAVEAATEKGFTSNADFKRRVVNVAVEEINKKSDITVSYDTDRTPSHEITGFIFTVRFKPEEEQEITMEEKEEIQEMISDLIDQPLKIRDIKAIAEAADYNYETVEKTYQKIIEAYGEDCDGIGNFVGFFINAIKDGYYDRPETSPKKSKNDKKKNQFNQFKQNQYDFDVLEKELAANLC